MVSLSVQVWPLIVDAVADQWAAETEALRPVRQVTLTHDGVRVLVAGSPVGGGRVDAAWSLSVALVEVMADPAFAGVPATVTVDGLVVDVPADTITALVAGGRAVWAAGVDVRVGQVVDPT